MQPVSASWGLRTRVMISIESEVSATFKRVTVPGRRWVVDMEFNPPYTALEQQQREAWFARLGGQENSALIWHPKKLAPLGTLRGTAEARTNGDPERLEIRNGSPGATLLDGDMIGVGQHLFMVTEPAQLTAFGTGFVQVAAPARGAIPWSAVLWDRPTARFILDGREVMVPWTYGECPGEGFSCRFVEVY